MSNQAHEVSYSGNTTTVNFDAGHGIIGVGVARCRPDDAFSKKTGEIIATGRAIQDAGRQVEAIGDAMVITVADLDKALAFIDEAADELGKTEMPVGSAQRAAEEEDLAAEEDEIVNQFLGMLIGRQFQDELEAIERGG